MIKVYFETKTHAELIAIFDNSETYHICLKELVKYAKKARGYITESVVEDVAISPVDEVIEKLQMYKGTDFLVNDELIEFIKAI